jgi:hypothetical protein
MDKQKVVSDKKKEQADKVSDLIDIRDLLELLHC